MNLNSIKQLSFSSLYKRAHALFARSNTRRRPVAYDWACIVLFTMVATAALAAIATYFYFFFSATTTSTTSLGTQTLTINRSVLSETLDLLYAHEHLFSKELESSRDVIDPSY